MKTLFTRSFIFNLMRNPLDERHQVSYLELSYLTGKAVHLIIEYFKGFG